MRSRFQSLKILASCHDLGGANQLLYSTLSTNTHYLLTGPAMQVAVNLNLSNMLAATDLDLSQFELVIVGSNKDFQLSDELLKNAKSLGIKTVGYLDHWVNYGTRWSTLPDIIIVTDVYAFIKGFFVFGLRVHLHQNLYLKYLRNNFIKNKLRLDFTQALFIVQPFKNGYTHECGFNICVCKYVHRFLEKKRVNRILIRDHATTNSDNCLSSLKGKYSNVTFLKSDWTHPLEEDIFQSEFIIGHDTYALYIAKKLGKRVRTMSRRRAWISPVYKSI